MDERTLAGLVDEINSFTPCKTQADAWRLKYLVRRTVETAEEHFRHPQVEDTILAMKLSAEWHAGMRRLNRVTPYIIHPLEVKDRLTTLGVHDFKSTIAAIIHDGVEDEKDKNRRYRMRKVITDEFGSTVREIVELLTKSPLPWKRKLFFPIMLAEKRIHIAWRTKAVKCADCDTNLDDYHEVFAPDKCELKALENLRDYPPVWDSMGRDLRKLVREGVLKAEPYGSLAERFAESITLKSRTYLSARNGKNGKHA